MTLQGAVLGSTGFLGSRLLDCYPEELTAGPSFRIHDLDELSHLEALLHDFLDRVPVQTIVNCVGLREGTDAELLLVNGDIPRVLANVAEARGLRMIHIGSAAELLRVKSGVDPEFARLLLRYSRSKKVGAEAVLGCATAVVGRIHNLHGLPHQASSSLHTLCRALKVLTGSSVEQSTREIVDVTRDYIHWEAALADLHQLLFSRTTGVVEIRSGVRISLRAIAEALPREYRELLIPRLVPADILTMPSESGDPPKVHSSYEATAMTLAEEVVTCAFS